MLCSCRGSRPVKQNVSFFVTPVFSTLKLFQWAKDHDELAFRMDALDALQLRDQEINKALSLANDILNEDPKQDPDTQVTSNDSDDMETLIGKQQIFMTKNRIF